VQQCLSSTSEKSLARNNLRTLIVHPSSKIITSNISGRRLVIPDIHGCVNTLKALLNQVNPSKEDHLFFLGDYVNKGPSSPETLDFLITLQKRTNCHFIMGNHDHAILMHLTGEVLQSDDRMSTWNSRNLNNHPNTKQYIEFLQSLHHFIELDDYFLVHAGFDFNSNDSFLNTHKMMNIVGIEYDYSKAKGKKIIHGHLPHPLEEIERNIKEGNAIIPLDNGCVYQGERKGNGRLLCFDLDSGSLVKQDKLD
jgi:serine/threonine protein phosphatase 1